MRKLSAIAGLAVASAIAGACGAAGPDRITEVRLAPPGEAGGPYDGEVVATADAERTVLIHEGDDPLRPARWIAARADGRIAWTRDHACPDFESLYWLDTVAERAVCKTRHAVVGVDLASGAEVWRWDSDARLFLTSRVGDRILTSADNQTLVVLDARDGRVLRRVALDGAVPQAGALAGGRPVALVLDDPNADPPALVAQPIDGESPPDAEPEALSPLWRVPFEAFERHVQPSGDTVKTVPRDGIEVSRALADGAFQWLDFLEIRPQIVWGPEAGVAIIHRDGAPLVAAVDPTTRAVLWQRPWPHAGPIRTARQLGERALLVGDGGWMLYRMADGAAVAGRPVEEGEAVAAVGASERAVTWVTDLGDRHRIDHDGLRVDADAFAPPEPPDRPDWLEPGARLVYGLVVHQGRDPETGYFREGQATHFVVDVESLDDGVTFAWQSGDGREGRRIIPEDVLRSSRRHSDQYAANEGERTLDHTSIWVSRAVATDLAEGREAAFRDASAVDVERLAPVGDAYHRAVFIPAGEETGPPRDLPAVLARADRRDATYWIAPWADYPLVLRAERPGFLIYLAAVQRASDPAEAGQAPQPPPP